MPVMNLPAALDVLPVLDLLGGEVVRAVRGERGAYRPMQSRLAAGSAPLALARALLDHPACTAQPPVLYIADLDAIQGRPVQLAVLGGLLQALCAERPGLRLWLDAGFASAAEAAMVTAALCTGPHAGPASVRPVYGSESLQSLDALAELTADPAAILSLDCRLDRALDPAGCWLHPGLWPATLIVMTLDRVGARGGPDLATFDRLRHPAAGRRMIGAGGIRDAADLAAGRAAGASAWLVATALHDGTLAEPAPQD